MNRLAEETGQRLVALGLRLVTAESCTGGMIAATATSVPGSSHWFEGALVTYRVSAKEHLLGIEGSVIASHGVVSEPVAKAMALGALERSEAHVSISVTGNAGPDGDGQNPVGTVWIGWAIHTPNSSRVITHKYFFSGDREAIRRQAVDAAFEGLLEFLDESAL